MKSKADHKLRFIAIWKGFHFFFSRPRLWIGPLFVSLMLWLLVSFLFLFSAYYTWPLVPSSWMNYTYRAFLSIGIGALCSLIFWVFVSPLILAFSFENLVKKTMLLSSEEVYERRFFKSIAEGAYVFFYTLHYRLIFLLLGVVFSFALGPFGVYLSQVFIAVLIFMDSSQATLFFRGASKACVLKLIRKNMSQIYTNSLMAGLFGLLLILTGLGWMFWLPGCYIGGYFISKEWNVHN